MSQICSGGVSNSITDIICHWDPTHWTKYNRYYFKIQVGLLSPFLGTINKTVQKCAFFDHFQGQLSLKKWA